MLHGAFKQPIGMSSESNCSEALNAAVQPDCSPWAWLICGGQDRDPKAKWVLGGSEQSGTDLDAALKFSNPPADAAKVTVDALVKISNAELRWPILKIALSWAI